jgi:macrolide transport system ATP-binding/permease protein
MVRRLRALWKNIFRRAQLDRELDDELRAYVDLAAAEHQNAGMTAEEARIAARRSTGQIESVKQNVRNVRLGISLDRLIQDLRYAVRTLANNRAFSAVAIITLALGIGANTAIFTLVHGILLRSLPVADPSHLYRIGDKNTCCYFDGFQNDNGDFDLFSYDLYLQFKESAPEFEQLAAVEAGNARFSVRYGNAPGRPLRAEYVSGNYFATLGVGAYAGRPLGEADDAPGAAPAVVLSYRSWQSDFAADPSLVGSTIYVDGSPFTVAGVAPPGFFGDRISPFPPDMWMPLASNTIMEGANNSLQQKDMDWLYALGRIRPGTNTSALQTRLSITLRQWLSTRSQYTDHGGAAEIPKQHVVLSPAGGGIQRLQEQTGKGLRLLMILSSIVLLIACANVANLLLARGAAHRAGIAMRMALGATRPRIIRQILTETVLLSLIGGLAGLMVAFAGSRMILALAFPQATNIPIPAHPSLPVLGFAMAVALLTGIVFGTAPAWALSHAQPAQDLRAIHHSTRDRSSLPQKSLVVLQVALSVVLLAGAFLMARSLYNLEHQDFGITVSNRYVVYFDLHGAGYTPQRLPAFYRQVDDRFSALPDMVNLSLARYIPLGGNEWGSCVIQQGHPAPGPHDKCFSTWDRVSWRFLESIGVPIIRGRNFNAQDATSPRQVVLVNQAFARQFFPGQDPIGRRFGIGVPQYSGAFEIAGVFADFKMTDARGDARPLFLRALGQEFTGYKDPDQQEGEKASLFLTCLILNFSHPQPEAESLIRRRLADIDPNVTIFRFAPYESELAANFNQDRLIARLTSLFGILALLLATVGIYGVMSYFVHRRTAEIGVRMALGATRSSVISIVLRGA